MDQFKRKVGFLFSKRTVFNVHFGQHFLQFSAKFLHRIRENDHEQKLPSMKLSIFGVNDCNPSLKRPVFFICTKFCIVVNSFLNKQSKKIVHAT